jgi:hypothetical protein
MAIQLKNNGNDDETRDGMEVGADFYDGMKDKPENDPMSKYRGGQVDLNDLPTYTGPTYIPDSGAGVATGKKQRSLVTFIIAV